MDNDSLFNYNQFQANLRILEIKALRSVPYTPLGHPFIKRLIGWSDNSAVRQDYLDNNLFWHCSDLEKKLKSFQIYYNFGRVHSSIDGSFPAQKAQEFKVKIAKLDNFEWKSFCNGMFSIPVAC